MNNAIYLTKHYALTNVKADDDDTADGPDLTALAAIYGKADRDNEVFATGAFADAELPVPLLRSHDRDNPVGRITLLRSEPVGLYVEAAFADATSGREARALTRDGGFPFLSVGVRYYESDARLDGAGRTVIHRAELLEVSVVTVPSNPHAFVLTAKADADGRVHVKSEGGTVDAGKLAGLIADELEARAAAATETAAKTAADDLPAELAPLDQLRAAAKSLGEPYTSAVTAHAEALLARGANKAVGVASTADAPTVHTIDAHAVLREVDDLIAGL